MNESDKDLESLATKVIAMIAQLYPQQSTAKKLDGSDDASYQLMVRTWMNALNGVSEAGLNNAIDALMNGGSTFEPSIPEFIALCKPKRLAAYHTPIDCRPGYVMSDSERLAFDNAQALPAPEAKSKGPHYSIFEEKLKHDRELKEKLKHIDDNLDEKKIKFMEGLNNCIETKGEQS